MKAGDMVRVKTHAESYFVGKYGVVRFYGREIPFHPEEKEALVFIGATSYWFPESGIEVVETVEEATLGA